MIIIMKPTSSEQEIRRVLNAVRVHRSAGPPSEPKVVRQRRQTVIVLDTPVIPADTVRSLPAVEKIVDGHPAYPLASLAHADSMSRVPVGEAGFGTDTLTVIAGPCAVESFDQTLTAAKQVKEAGAALFRAGAFKPRTNPYSFQGLGKEGLDILVEVRRLTGLGIVTEALSPTDVDAVAEHADMLQVGSRNMANFELLKAVGQSQKPVLLKRGFMATVDEWLNAAEYILAEGNENVVLCERGIRTHESYTRNTLDLGGAAALKTLTHLPVIADPSHGTGRRALVAPLAKAAVACNLDGLILEVHPDPDHSWTSDGAQSLTTQAFGDLMRQLESFAALNGRTLAASKPAVVSALN